MFVVVCSTNHFGMLSAHTMYTFTKSFGKNQQKHKTKCKLIGVLLDITFADAKDAFPNVPVEGAVLPAVSARFVSVKCMKVFYFIAVILGRKL